MPAPDRHSERSPRAPRRGETSLRLPVRHLPQGGPPVRRAIGRYTGALFVFAIAMAIGVVLALAIVSDPARITP